MNILKWNLSDNYNAEERTLAEESIGRPKTLCTYLSHAPAVTEIYLSHALAVTEIYLTTVYIC